MRRIALLWLAALSLSAATRPRYGGVLRVEIREAIETPDPPQTGPGLARLNGAFSLIRWEPGRVAVFQVMEDAPGGRPFLDGVEVQLARPLRDQSIDLETGRADVVELGPNELRRPGAARKTWTSLPVRLVALVFGPRVENARVREALALAVDRAAIHTVLLQRQGEITGALLPQWLSGYAFLFPAAPDAARARSLIAGLPAASRSLSLGVDDPLWQSVAARIELNARYAGLAVSVVPPRAVADVRLVEVRIASGEPARALSEIAAGLGLAQPASTESPEELFAAERALLDGFRVVPLFHVPDVYGASPRVKGGPGISPLGEWRFENLWIEASRP
jgi:peptide/nickel transport system substrate-binding protein